MANLSRGGLWPIMNQIAATAPLKRVRIASNNATAIFWGDAGTRTGAGVWGLATAGSGIGGVFQGAEIWDAAQQVRRPVVFIPVTTTYASTKFDFQGETDMTMAFIVADPASTRYEIELSGSTPALSDMTKNANFVATAGSTATGLSGHRLNQATINTTNTLDLAIMDIKRSVSNDPNSTAAKVIVQINVSVLPGSAGATGQ